MAAGEKVVALVEHPSGDVVAVLFPSRDAAEAWEAAAEFEVLGIRWVMSAAAFSRSAAKHLNGA